MFLFQVKNMVNWSQSLKM